MSDLLVSIGEDTSQLSSGFVKAQEFYAIKSGYVFKDIPKLYARIDIALELAFVDPKKMNEEQKEINKKVDKKEKSEKKRL